jgi:hypothetical protein
MMGDETALNPIHTIEDRQYRVQVLTPEGEDDGINDNPRARQTVNLICAALDSVEGGTTAEIDFVEARDGRTWKFRVVKI